jgi:cysteine-rich repeat protein
LNARTLCFVVAACAGCNALFGIEDPIHVSDQLGAGSGGLAGSDQSNAGQAGSAGTGGRGGINGSGGTPNAGTGNHPDAAGDGGDAGGPVFVGCGDGVRLEPEQCDDQNAVAGDGCTECAIDSGFTCAGKSPTSCTDIDECGAGSAQCSPQATCSNTPGSFTCTCKPGWSGDGMTCTRLSCVGLAQNCGPLENADCCASPKVTGGTVFRGNTTSYPGTVKDFTLDKYEVTVARFNKFVNAYQGPPAGNAAEISAIPGSGWKTTWNSAIAEKSDAIAAGVQCHTNYQTWRGSNEERALSRLPINCVSWYEAFAFCVWDGGRLPTDVEFEYAASGGENESTYPWGETLSPEYAIYNCTGDGQAGCLFADITPVGSRPKGAGRWGQLDLTGSMEEWMLDTQGAYVTECGNNCANITPGPKLVRGGMWEYPSPPALQAATTNNSALPDLRDQFGGFRCANSL